jgi:hypothetical protein
MFVFERRQIWDNLPKVVTMKINLSYGQGYLPIDPPDDRTSEVRHAAHAVVLAAGEERPNWRNRWPPSAAQMRID